MENKQIEALGHQLKGALKQGLGRLIGDAKLQADGAAERAAGVAQNASSVGPTSFGGVDTDRIMGVGHEIKGAIKEGLGNITGNPDLTAAGIAEHKIGITQNAAGSARDEARDTPKL